MKIRLSAEQLKQLAADPWLTDRERMVLNLYYRRGWAIEDVAAEMDCSRGTVNNILRLLLSSKDFGAAPAAPDWRK